MEPISIDEAFLDLSGTETLHGGWPAVIVQQLRTVLPTGYVAGPKVHAGARDEIGVPAYRRDDGPSRGEWDRVRYGSAKWTSRASVFGSGAWSSLTPSL